MMAPEQYDLLAKLEDSHWWFVGRRRILRAIVEEVLPATPRGVIVDIGCGAGANVAQFAGRHQCLGIDAAKEVIAHARRRFPGVTFLLGDRPEDQADVLRRANLLLVNDVLEHVEGDRAFLARLVSLAAPGAALVITVPADMTLWGPHDVSHGHFRRYSRVSMNALWDGLPVDVRLVSYFNARLYPIVRFVRALGRLRNRAWGYANTDLRRAPWPVNGILTNVFAGEADRLRRALRGDSAAIYRQGVSLIAVLSILARPAAAHDE